MELNKALPGQSTLSKLFSRRGFLIGAIIAGVVLLGVIGYFVARFAGLIPTAVIQQGGCSSSSTNVCLAEVSVNQDQSPTYAVSATGEPLHFFGVVNTLNAKPGYEYQVQITVNSTDASKTVVLDPQQATCADADSPPGLNCNGVTDDGNITNQLGITRGHKWTIGTAATKSSQLIFEFSAPIACSKNTATDAEYRFEVTEHDTNTPDFNTIGIAVTQLTIPPSCTFVYTGICVPNNPTSAPCLNFYTLTGEGGVAHDQFTTTPVLYDNNKEWIQKASINTTNRLTGHTYKVREVWPADFPGSIPSGVGNCYEISNFPASPDCDSLASGTPLNGTNGTYGYEYTLKNPGPWDDTDEDFELVMQVTDCSKVTSANRQGLSKAEILMDDVVVGSYSIPYIIDPGCGPTTEALACTITVTPSSATVAVGEVIGFSAQVTPAGTVVDNYAWDFTNGTTPGTSGYSGGSPATQSGSGASSVSETYATSGSKTATLVVTTSTGATANCQTVVTITGGGGGTPTFSCILSASPRSGTAPLPVTFTGTLTVSPANYFSGQDLNIGLEYGDSTKGYTAIVTAGDSPIAVLVPSVTHTYATSGSFTATLSISPPSPVSPPPPPITCSTGISVSGAETPTISCASLSASPASMAPGDSTTFTMTPSVSSGSVPSQVTWTLDFGDSTATQTQTNDTSPFTAAHTYAAAGTYTAAVTALSASGFGSGQISNCTVQITVRDTTTFQFECAGLSLYADATSPTFVTPANAPAVVSGTTVYPGIELHFIGSTPPVDWAYTIDYGDGSAPFASGTLPPGPTQPSAHRTAHTYSLPAGTTTSVQYTAIITAISTPNNSNYTASPISQSACSKTLIVNPVPVNPSCPATLNGLSKLITDSDETNQASTTSHPGELLTYTITYVNPGSSVGPVSLTDDFDERYVSIPGAIADGGVNNGNTVTWAISSIPAAGSITRTLQVRISNSMPSINTPIVNIASIAFTGSPTTTVCATSTVVPTTTNQQPFLAISKTVDTNACTLLQRGNTVRYTISVDNSGNATAHNVTVTDDIPPYLSGFHVIQIPSGAQDQSTATGGINGTGFLKVTGFDLAAGTSAQIVFDATIGSNAPAGAAIDNIATATDQENDRATARVILTVNQVCTTTTVVTVPGQTTTVTRIVTVTPPPPITVQPATGLSGWALAGLITLLYIGIGYAAYWILQKRRIDVEV